MTTTMDKKCLSLFSGRANVAWRTLGSQERVMLGQHPAAACNLYRIPTQNENEFIKGERGKIVAMVLPQL